MYTRNADDLAQVWSELILTANEMVSIPGFVPMLGIAIVASVYFGAKIRRHNLSKRKKEIPEQYRLR